jgi:hypothetical protein
MLTYQRRVGREPETSTLRKRDCKVLLHDNFQKPGTNEFGIQHRDGHVFRSPASPSDLGFATELADKTISHGHFESGLVRLRRRDYQGHQTVERIERA